MKKDDYSALIIIFVVIIIFFSGVKVGLEYAHEFDSPKKLRPSITVEIDSTGKADTTYHYHK